MLLQNLYVPFSIYGAVTDVQVPHDAIGTNTPPYHHRCWLMNFVLITIRMVLFLFGQEDTTSMISKNNLQCGLVRPQHTFPLCASPLQMSSGQEKPAPFLDVVDIWLSLCIVEFQLALVDVATNCVNWQRFSKEFLSPSGKILDRMMSVFNAVPPEGSKVTGINVVFSALPLTCRFLQIL